jgi:hypothetical protein
VVQCTRIRSAGGNGLISIRELIPQTKNAKREGFLLLFHNLALREPVLACQQELRSHVQAILRADVIALGAEDALGDKDADTLCCRKEFDGMSGADLQAELASDARLTVIGDLSPESRGHRHGGGDGRLTLSNTVQEFCHRGREVASRKSVRGRFFEELL